MVEEETQTDAPEQEAVSATTATETTEATAENPESAPVAATEDTETSVAGAEEESAAPVAGDGATTVEKHSKRAQKVGTVSSDKMTKTCVVRVDRLIKHPKYRRYVRRTSKFMAHNDMGATIGDRVLIIETRPLSARKRWRVAEIIQKAAK